MGKEKSDFSGVDDKIDRQPSPYHKESRGNKKKRQELLELLGFSIDRSTDMIVFLTKDGRYVYANDAACRNLDYARDELLSKNVRDIALDYTDEAWQCIWDRAKNRGSASFQSRFAASDGRIIPVEISAYRFECRGADYLCGFSRDISERIGLEEGIKDSRRKLSRAQEIARMGNWEWDLLTNEVILSDEIYGIFGGEPGSFSVKYDRMLSFVYPGDRENLAKLFNESLSAGQPSRADLRIVRPDGTIAHVHIETDAPVRDGAGKPVKIFGIVQDITERKLAELSLKQKFSELEAISQVMPDLYFRMTTDGIILDYRAGTAADLFVSPDVFLGRRIQEVLPPEIGRQFDQAVCDALKSGTRAVIEYSLPLAGGVKVFEARLLPLMDDQVIVVIRNITGQKSVEDALRRIQQKLLKAQQIAHLGSWEWDVVSDEVSYIAEAFNDYFGPAALSDHSERSFLQLVHPQDREDFAKITADTLANKETFGFDHRIITREGEARYVRTEGEVVRDVARRPLKVIGVTQDITERKLIEAALRESEEKFRVLSESSPFGILVTQNDRIVYANPAVVAVSGYTNEEFRQMDYWGIIHPDSRNMSREYTLARLRGEQAPSRYELSFLAKSGKEKWVESFPIVIMYNGQPAILMTLIDITDRKAGEEALKESKADVDLYLDLMSHDINNMNMIATGNIEFAICRLQSKGGLDADDRLLLERSIETLRGASRLIDNVRKLRKEKRGEYKTKIIDVETVLRESVAHYSGVPGRDVTIRLSCEPGCRVHANELLKDVFLNLIGNAIKHSGGPLTIDVNATRTVTDGIEFCMVTIEDTGPGIPDDRKRWLMDQTPAPVPRSTGQEFGLRLVKSLVDDFHGRFLLEDRVPGDYGRGSRFVVMLPAGEDASR
ncbi:MAG TPA: PAS domain S-box protein [Methanocella sp.]